MHIAINTAPMSGGHSQRGIGLYTKELINALSEFEASHTYSFFTRASEISAKADIVHYPFFDPFFLTLPWKASAPTVVTVHDLIPIVHSAHFPPGIRGQLKWQAQKHTLKRVARSIVTDSHASKDDIERVLGFPSERVFAIPLAPRQVFQPVTSDKTLSELRKKYILNNKFILYVGDVNWNKNILGLLDAFRLYEKTAKQPIRLVLVGKAFTDEGVAETQVIHKFVRQHGLQDKVFMPGFVTDGDLAGLYSLAEALVYPSFAEGFGLPVLEAMSCDCPVVTSNASSLVEIAGPAITVDPLTPADIRRGIDMVLSLSLEKRQSIIASGRKWASRFTWETVAHKTIKVYEKTFNNRSSL